MIKKNETERLILCPFEMEYAAKMFEMDSNPLVLRYIGTPPLTKIEQSEDGIRFIQKQYEENGVGRLAVILKETNEFIGWAGLKLIKEEMNGHINFYDVGYRFLPQYWGKGYGSEASIASVKMGFEDYKAEKICGLAMPENIPSRKILEKSGLKYINDFLLEGEKFCWYETDLS
jgi:[ribosomal protein S5]-alanine N-acetyltransferase